MKQNKNQIILNESEKNKRIKVYSCAVIFSIIVGFSFIGIKTCLPVATPLEILTYRFNFAFFAIIVGIIIGWTKINVKEKRKNKLLITSGFYVGFMILQTIGLRFATSIESGIIFAIIPIMAKIIAGIVLKETTSWKQNVFVCLSVAALIFMFVFGATDMKVNLMGLVILFLSSLSMAMSNVFMRYVRVDYTPMEITFYIVTVGFIVFNLTTVILGMKNGTLGNYFGLLSSLNFVVATAYLGILSTLISALLMSYMLANMEAIKATVFGNLSTAISIVAGVIILHEPLCWYHIVCTIFIILGVIGVSLPSMGKKKEESTEESSYTNLEE